MFDAHDPKRILNYRPLLFIAVGFTAGILAYEAYRGLALPSASFFGALFMIIIAAFSVLFSFFKGRSRARTLFVVSFLVAFLRMSVAMPEAVETGEYRLTGVVCEVSESSENTVTLTDVRLDDKRFNYKVILSIQGEDSVIPAVGDSIVTTCRVREPSGGHDSGSLSRLANGVGLRARCKTTEILSSNSLPFTVFFNNARSFLKDKISAIFPQNSEMVSAFLLGDRSELDYGDLDAFRKTGTAHLMTLSGFHVAILVGAIVLFIPKRYSKFRFFSILGFLLFYCAMTNFPPSLVRATVMSTAVLLAEVTERRRDSLSSLSLAAIVILAVSPYSLWSAGFRLSFAATMGILFLADQLDTDKASPIKNKIRTSAAVTFSAYAATMLITARYFGYVNTYVIPANLIAVPVYSIAITLSFILLILGIPLQSAAHFFAWLPDRMIGGTTALLSKTAELPFAQVSVRPPLEITGVLMLLLLFLLSPYILRPIRQRVKIAAPIMFLFTASIVFSIIGT